jgi:DNA-binding NtrC family response regulator
MADLPPPPQSWHPQISRDLQITQLEQEKEVLQQEKYEISVLLTAWIESHKDWQEAAKKLEKENDYLKSRIRELGIEKKKTIESYTILQAEREAFYNNLDCVDRVLRAGIIGMPETRD